ncbi:MBL fold metallo-hydrolase [Nocardia sp. NPDC052001]|uniref:MBL fold metallo-hydrolase n=1 Tax=Nocardia sp. NPDC052001 TaxID=3154853 RepID=UPI00343EEEC3
MLGGGLIDGRSHGLRAPLTCHVILRKNGDGTLTLIDAGPGQRAVTQRNAWLGGGWSFVFAPEADPALTAVEQIRRLGLDPAAVTDVVLTHLDMDHAGGLVDFPDARVWVNRREFQAQATPRNAGDRGRYRPVQFEHHPRWQLFDIPAIGGQDWFGFPAVPLEAVPGVWVVSLPGHSAGHTGVAVENGDDTWTLHAGDAYYLAEQMDVRGPRRTPGIALFEWFGCDDPLLRVETQSRLLWLKRDHGHRVEVVNSHSLAELTPYLLSPAVAGLL